MQPQLLSNLEDEIRRRGFDASVLVTVFSR